MAQQPHHRNTRETATPRAVFEYLIVPLVVQPYEASFAQATTKLNGYAADGWRLTAYNSGVAVLEREAPLAQARREA